MGVVGPARPNPVRHNPAVLTRGTGTRIVLLAAAVSLLLALPAASAPAASGPPSLALDGPKRPSVGDKIVATGQVPGFAPGEQVTIEGTASGRAVFSKKVTPKANGTFATPFVIKDCCAYSITASAGGKASAPQTLNVGVPKHLSKGPVAKLFNKSLQAQGFHTGTRGPRVTSGTHLAIKAFRKVNGMSWSEAYAPSIFRTLLQGKGAFQPRFDDGKHVEVDISKQVMALVDGKTPVHTFHVSTGTGGTPTVLGNYHFYLKQPGYNSKRMYYSVYFVGGYATHGYSSVPNGRASHGCVRNPIQFSRFIYNWIDLGDPMHTYA
jgi:lipoprotein-anchoring transpeptidase ErfK/SrfK